MLPRRYGEYGPPREGGRNARRQGCLGRRAGPGTWFPPDPSPRAPPSPSLREHSFVLQFGGSKAGRFGEREMGGESQASRQLLLSRRVQQLASSLFCATFASNLQGKGRTGKRERWGASRGRPRKTERFCSVRSVGHAAVHPLHRPPSGCPFRRGDQPHPRGSLEQKFLKI